MKIFFGLVILIVALVLVVLALPFLVDINRYQDQYRPILEEVLNRKVSIGTIRLTIIPRLGARVSGLTVQDDPAFGSSPFASLESLDIGIKLLPLLDRRIEVEALILRNPVITVVKSTDGTLNVSTLGKKGGKSPESPRTPAPSTTLPAEGPLKVLAMLAVDDISLTGGKLIYHDMSSATPTDYTLDSLDFHVRALALGQTPGVHLAMTVLPFKLPMTLDGTFGPLQETTDIKDLDFALRVGGSVFMIKGSVVAGKLDLDLSSPVINFADFPLPFSFTRPIQVHALDLHINGQYPLPEGMSVQEAMSVQKLGLDVVMGNSVVNIEGSTSDGMAKLSVASPMINVSDLPLQTPLAKPVQVKDFRLVAETRYPLADHAQLPRAINVPSLGFVASLGNSVVTVKGSGQDGDITIFATSPTVSTSDLPIALPMKKPLEVKNLRIRAVLNSERARVEDLSLTLLGGQVKSSGSLTLGTKPMPFDGHLSVQALQLGPTLAAFSDEPVSVSGTAATEVDLHGQGFTMPELTRALEATGHLVVRDGKIEGVNLLKEVMALLNAVGIKLDGSNATVFSRIESTMTVKSGVLNLAQLVIDNQDFQATGHGTMGFDQSLNMKANLSLSETLSKNLGGRLGLGRVTGKGRFSVPILITGSAQKPIFALDAAGMGTKVKEQVQETVDELLKGKPDEALQKGRDMLKGLFR